jgi:hypothetical protein
MDTARNLHTGIQGVREARRDGLNWQNGLKMAGFLGARGNISTLNRAGKGGVVGRTVYGAENWAAGKVIHGALGNTRLHDPLARFANRIGYKVCFAAGTPLRTPDGAKAIEAFRPGDLILSRDEHDPAGEVVTRAVEEVFVREGLIWHLHVRGQVIRTTAEHPFYARGRGWVACHELAVGDWLLAEDGHWVTVEDLLDTGCWETVYNLQVADSHTYFVGCGEWGFAVWAHNADCVVLKEKSGGKIVYRARSTTGEILAEGKTYADTVKAAKSAGHTVHDVVEVRKAFLTKHGFPEELIGPSGYPYRHMRRFSEFKDMREAGFGTNKRVAFVVREQPRRVPGRVDKHVNSPTPPGSKWGGHTHSGGAVFRTVFLSDGTRVSIKYPKIYNVNRRGGTASIYNKGPVDGVRFEVVPTWKLLRDVLGG